MDVVHYGTNDSADPGLSALYPGATYVDEGALGDKDTDSIGRIPNGMSGTFQTLDTPTPGAPNFIPEPTLGLVTLLSLLGVVAIRRRR